MDTRPHITFACKHCAWTFDCHDRDYGEVVLMEHLREHQAQEPKLMKGKVVLDMKRLIAPKSPKRSRTHG